MWWEYPPCSKHTPKSTNGSLVWIYFISFYKLKTQKNINVILSFLCMKCFRSVKVKGNKKELSHQPDMEGPFSDLSHWSEHFSHTRTFPGATSVHSSLPHLQLAKSMPLFWHFLKYHLLCRTFTEYSHHPKTFFI